MDNYSLPTSSAVQPNVVIGPQSNMYNYPPPPNFDYASNFTYPNYEQPGHFSAQTTYDPSLQPPDGDQKSDDVLFVEAWLSRIGKIQINLDSACEIKRLSRAIIKKQNAGMKISTAKKTLRRCLHIHKKLADVRDRLRKDVGSMSTTEWQKGTTEINNLKNEFVCLESQFENVETLTLLKKSVEQRKKKRTNQKRRRTRRREQTARELEDREALHKDIDQWLENMKDAVERAKMEESMQKDADCVLSEVTKKRSDARKQLSLLSALIKLRNVRENAAVHRGEKVPLEDRSAFNKLTEKLTKMWEDTSKVYAKEEQGLRIMLEKNATEDSNLLRQSKYEKLIQQWYYVFFGPKCVTSRAYWNLTAAERDVEGFIAIRKGWDSFLVGDGDECGSRIPIGWALPSASANEEWTKYLSD